MKLDKQQKENLVIRYRGGETVQSICKDVGVSKSSVYAWIKEYDENSKKITSLDSFKLATKLNRNEQKVELLQSVNCTVNSTLKVRLNCHRL